MRIEHTPLKDCFVINNTVYNDPRGYFFESFNQEKFSNITGLSVNFVQDNQSRSHKGVLRGLHFQTGQSAQAKLVRVLRGEVMDVVVDLRKSSPTFGQHFTIHLSESSNTQLFVPRGFAHGFVVLSDMADFFYKCDNYYNSSAESGLIYNDETLNIDWKVDTSAIFISEKDAALPVFSKEHIIFE